MDVSSSFGSTYSSATLDYEQSVGFSRTTVEGLKETAPLLFKGTASFTESPSPLQSWKAVIAELLGPQRLWAIFVSALVASLSSLLAGYTLGYPSKSMMELSQEQSFNNSLLLDMFGVSHNYTVVLYSEL